MSDSEDDFVEVSGYKSSDSSEWEKISSAGYSSFEEGDEEGTRETTTKGNDWPQDLVASYYQSTYPKTAHTTSNVSINPSLASSILVHPHSIRIRS